MGVLLVLVWVFCLYWYGCFACIGMGVLLVLVWVFCLYWYGYTAGSTWTIKYVYLIVSWCMSRLMGHLSRYFVVDTFVCSDILWQRASWVIRFMVLDYPALINIESCIGIE